MPKGETLKAEFNMGQLDFFRWNITLESVLEKRYSAFRYGEIKDYWCILDSLYAEIRPVLVAALRAKFDAQFAELTLVKSGKRLYNIEKMVAFENDLRIQRQNIGAGVPTKFKRSESRQINAGFKR